MIDAQRLKRKLINNLIISPENKKIILVKDVSHPPLNPNTINTFTHSTDIDSYLSEMDIIYNIPITNTDLVSSIPNILMNNPMSNTIQDVIHFVKRSIYSHPKGSFILYLAHFDTILHHFNKDDIKLFIDQLNHCQDRFNIQIILYSETQSDQLNKKKLKKSKDKITIIHPIRTDPIESKKFQ